MPAPTLINRVLGADRLSAPIDISGLVAGIVVLGFVQGAYSTEVLRGAIQAVPQGQIEAARAYGMSPGPAACAASPCPPCCPSPFRALPISG